MKDAVFVDKTSAKALSQSKRTVLEDLEKQISTETTFEEAVSKRNAELLGVLPYMFCFSAYVFENFKDMIIDAPDITHYQFGTEEDPITMNVLYKFTIGPYTNQKEHFHAELYRYMSEVRKYWLPSKSGGYLFDEPIRIIPIVKGKRVPAKTFHNLVTRQKDGSYQQETKEASVGFILQCFKPLFEGHFNGWQSGFIKQPPLLYAIAREYHQNMRNEADFGEFTPVKIIQTFYYIATHCNGIGNKITINVLNLLKHVLESALEGDTIKYTRIKTVIYAIKALSHITHDHANSFDFQLGQIYLDAYDQSYACRQDPTLNIKHDSQGVGYIDLDFQGLCHAVKHHIRANKNTLELGVRYNKEEEQKNVHTYKKKKKK